MRFGPKPIHAPYKVRAADYMAIHKQSYVQQYAASAAQPCPVCASVSGTGRSSAFAKDMTRYLKPNAVCVINCSWDESELEAQLPAKMRKDLAAKQAGLPLHP